MNSYTCQTLPFVQRIVSVICQLSWIQSTVILCSYTLRSDFHCETYIGISPYRTLRSDFHCETYIGISPYRTLRSDFHCETYIGISPYRTLRSDFHCETYIGISPYRTLRSDFQCEAYIGISPYRTLAVVELQSMAVMLCVTWSCEKIQTFIFRAIWENTAHVQWIRNKE